MGGKDRTHKDERKKEARREKERSTHPANHPLQFGIMAAPRFLSTLLA
jgi:hypothetical protein